MEPFRVHDEPLGNDIDPDLAVPNGRVFISWQTDTGGDPNLFVHYRVFDLDGVPEMPTAERLALVDDTGLLSASAWMTKIAPLPGGGFAIAGAFADPSRERWQAFLVRRSPRGGPFLDGEGQEQGLIRLYAEAGGSQTAPALLSMANGGIFAAWDRARDDQA